MHQKSCVNLNRAPTYDPFWTHVGYAIGCCLVLPMRKHDVKKSGGAAATAGSTWYAKCAPGGVAH